jgi:hypothetical protein
MLDWLSIESAPKDGRPVILLVACEDFRTQVTAEWRPADSDEGEWQVPYSASLEGEVLGWWPWRGTTRRLT